MKATQQLNKLGQSLWLDNITRQLLDSGTLKKYIDELSITGLTSNPTIFDHAMTHGNSYDDDMAKLMSSGKSVEDAFFEMAIDDLRRAADLFADIHQRTSTVDGWVSLEVSPLLAYDAVKTAAVAKQLHQKAARPNLFIKIPGTTEGRTAIEEAIFAGVSVNVTLLFSREHYLGAVEAYMRGLERRVEAGLSADVRSVASLFVSRWDKATMDKVPGELRDKIGPAVGAQTYKAYRDVLESDRWQRLENSARGRNVCSSPAQEPRIPRPRMSSTSAHWPRLIRLTPCRRRPCWPLPSTAPSEPHSRAMAEIANKCWLPMARPASTSPSWRPICSPKAQSRLSIPGKIC